jgi:hypothetical protein
MFSITPEDYAQLVKLIDWHKDMADQCCARRRVSEQTLEELTVKFLRILSSKVEVMPEGDLQK